MSNPTPEQPGQFGQNSQFPVQPGAAATPPPYANFSEGPAPTPGSGPAPRRRRRWIPWTVGAVAVAVLGAGAGIGVPMIANATQRGADSAQSAAERINEAVAKKDALGIAKLFSPAEVDSYMKNMDALMKDSGLDEAVKAQGGDMSSKASMEAMQEYLDAIEIRSSSMEYKITPRSENIATVDLTKWQLDASVDVNKLADAMERAQKRTTGKDAPKGMRESITKDVKPEDTSFNGDVIAKAGSPLSLVLVKEGSRWYISPMMTFAEIARVEAKKSSSSSSLGEPNWAADVNGTAGAASASEAVSGLADTAARINDPQDLLDPAFAGKLALPERRLLMVYGPALMPKDEQRKADPSTPYFTAQWALKEHRISDDLVIVSAGTTKITDGSGSGESVSFDGAKITADGSTVDVGSMLKNTDRLGVAAVKENGTWRLSTLDTMTNLLTMRATDEGVAKGKDLFSELVKSAGSEAGTLGTWDELGAYVQNLFGVGASFVSGFEELSKTSGGGGYEDYSDENSGSDYGSSDSYGSDGDSSGDGGIGDALGDILGGISAGHEQDDLTNPQTVPAGAGR